MKNDQFFNELMAQEVSVPLGAIIGSSFELNKCLHAATKVQRIPMKEINIAESNLDLGSLMQETEDVTVIPKICEVSSLETGKLSDVHEETPKKDLVITCNLINANDMASG